MMMIEKEILEKSIKNCGAQMKAVLAVIASGRSAGTNSFEFNNLLKCKESLEELLAAQTSKKK